MAPEKIPEPENIGRKVLVHPEKYEKPKFHLRKILESENYWEKNSGAEKLRLKNSEAKKSWRNKFCSEKFCTEEIFHRSRDNGA